MDNQENLRFIPMEVVKGQTILTDEYKNIPLRYLKIGNRTIVGILVPATDAQYKAYMRPIWLATKRRQRMTESRRKREKAAEEHVTDKMIMAWDTPVSYESCLEAGLDFTDAWDTAGSMENRQLKVKLYEELAHLETVDRIITEMFMNGCSESEIGEEVGLSQKAVNKRKHKIFEFLRRELEAFV